MTLTQLPTTQSSTQPLYRVWTTVILTMAPSEKRGPLLIAEQDEGFGSWSGKFLAHVMILGVCEHDT